MSPTVKRAGSLYLNIAATDQIPYFIQGLLPDLKNHVIMQQPKTFEEAENAACIRNSLPAANQTMNVNNAFFLFYSGPNWKKALCFVFATQ